MNDIVIHAFDTEGMRKVYDNGSWIIGIKNYKPANDIANLDLLERHNLTDESFILLSGGCILLSADEKSGLEFEALAMEPYKVYVIPKGVWHTTITEKTTKLILVEASETSEKNSDLRRLSKEETRKGVSAALAAGWKT